LTFEASQFLVSIVLDWRRQKKGAFAGVTSFSDRLAIDMTSNLVKAAISDIPYDEIGKRLIMLWRKKRKSENGCTMRRMR